MNHCVTGTDALSIKLCKLVFFLFLDLNVAIWMINKNTKSIS